MLSFAGFAICAVIIFFAGKKLSLYGEMIADLTGWGKAWVGLILLASVTSLPELMVGVSSTYVLEAPDLAVGDILGSCAFNLGILAMLDAFVPGHKTIFGTASQSHVLAATLGIILLAMVALGLYLPDDLVAAPSIGLTSIGFIVIYFVSVRLLYKYELKRQLAAAVVVEKEHGIVIITLKKAVLFYCLYAAITIAAALFLPYFADNIAEQTGLGKTFVGTLFLAASTSLPEIAVSYSAIRRGSIDLSVGNLLGSNMFNIFILALDDIWYTKGHLLKDASDTHMISVLFIILMSAIAIIGLSYRVEKKRYLMALDAFLIFSAYILNMLLLYVLTA